MFHVAEMMLWVAQALRNRCFLFLHFLLALGPCVWVLAECKKKWCQPFHSEVRPSKNSPTPVLQSPLHLSWHQQQLLLYMDKPQHPFCCEWKTNLMELNQLRIGGFSVAAAGFKYPDSSPFLFICSVNNILDYCAWHIAVSLLIALFSLQDTTGDHPPDICSWSLGHRTFCWISSHFHGLLHSLPLDTQKTKGLPKHFPVLLSFFLTLPSTPNFFPSFSKGHGMSDFTSPKWELLSRFRLFATPWNRPWNSPGQNTGMGSHTLLQGISQPTDWTQVSQIAGRFLPGGSPGKPKNTGVGSLSLLQWIFPIQESNQGLLHCRWILYQLSYQGSQGSSTSPALELWSLNHWTAKEVPPKCFVLGVSPCVCQSRERKQEQAGQAMYHDADLMSVTEEGMEGELGGKRPGCLLCSSEKVLVRLLSSGAKNTCHSTCGAGMTWL